MQSKLSPCPFCGGEAQLEQTGNKKITISCRSCHAKMVQKVLRYSVEWLEESMTKDWNKRAAQQGGQAGANMSDYYKDTLPLEFISDVYDIMKDGDNLTSERLVADVVDMLGKYLSAQQGEQRTCDHERTLRMPSGNLFCVVCQEYIA